MTVSRPVLGALLLSAVVAMLAACVPSLNPLYTEKDLVFEEALLGSWIDADDDLWRFERSTGSSYVLTYDPTEADPPDDQRPERPAQFEAHLVRLGDALFLDLLPEDHPDGSDLDNDLLALHLVPTHTFSRIWIDKGAVRIGMLDPEWLDRELASGAIEVAHERREQGIVLTASTEELQAFASSIADDAQAFGIEIELVRRQVGDRILNSKI